MRAGDPVMMEAKTTIVRLQQLEFRQDRRIAIRAHITQVELGLLQDPTLVEETVIDELNATCEREKRAGELDNDESSIAEANKTIVKLNSRIKVKQALTELRVSAADDYLRQCRELTMRNDKQMLVSGIKENDLVVKDVRARVVELKAVVAAARAVIQVALDNHLKPREAGHITSLGMTMVLEAQRVAGTLQDDEPVVENAKNKIRALKASESTIHAREELARSNIRAGIANCKTSLKLMKLLKVEQEKGDLLDDDDVVHEALDRVDELEHEEDGG